MKTSLDHLPLHKREQLAAITAMLRESAPVEMVIEARYSLSYHITAEELRIPRERVLDLASRVRHACMTKLMTISETGSIGELPTLPADEGEMQLPPLPDLADAKAVENWHAAIIELSYERGEVQRLEGRREGEEVGEARGRRAGEEVGEARGRREGEAVGETRGRREGEALGRARAIVDVLTRRGLTLRELQSARILCCRDEAKLARWWELAWTAASVDGLWDDTDA